MSRYRKIEVKMWGDEKFRALSPLLPSGQSLWLFLLTGPHTGIIPGLFRGGRAAMAEELGWEQEYFDKAFAEAFALGMVKADWKARVVWVPKGVKYNQPESPNVVTGWGKEFELIPECALKYEALDYMKASIYELSEAYQKAFDKAFEKAFTKALGNQEQEQEQEQQQEQKQKKDQNQPRCTTPSVDAQSNRAEDKSAEKAAPGTGKVWAAYGQAYFNAYGVAPVRNAKVNGQLSELVKRLGAEEAPHVAAFYLTHKNRFYVEKMHPTGLLLADCEKLRTEWATRRQMTSAAAAQADKTQTNLNAFQPLIDAAMAEEARNLGENDVEG